MEEVSAQGLHALIEAREDIVLIDVREEFEFAGGHVAQAKNIPMGEIGGYVEVLSAHDVVYFICRSGGRSAMICRELEKRGVHSINVDGGMMMWQMQQLPVVS